MAKVDAVTWRFAVMRWDYGCGEWVEDNDIVLLRRLTNVQAIPARDERRPRRPRGRVSVLRIVALTSVDKGAVITRGQRHRPCKQAHVVVGPKLDGRQPETAGVHEFPQPWPGAVIEAHQVTAMGLVPGEFPPRVRGAPAGLVEVVVDSRILVALDQERVEAGARARCPLGRQVDVPQELAGVRVVDVHGPQQFEGGRWALRQDIALDRGHVVVQARPKEGGTRVAVDRGIVIGRVEG